MISVPKPLFTPDPVPDPVPDSTPRPASIPSPGPVSGRKVERIVASIVSVGVSVGIAMGALLAAGPAGAAFPDDFAQETLATGLDSPVAVEVLPDGRILFAEQKTGDIEVALVDGTLGSAPAVTVTGMDTVNGEAGLLSLAVDPGWPTRPYVYCHFTNGTPNEMRLRRYTASGDLTDPQSTSITLGSPLEILTGIPDEAGNHNGGTLLFGPDGMLYFSLGDDEVSCAAQVLDDFRGKILRMDVSGLGASGTVDLAELVADGNPHVGSGPIASLVWAHGLRNPFRMAVDAQTGSLFVGDVGENRREEIDHVETGGLNLGWPWREGSLDFEEPAACTEPSNPDLLDPIHDYPHSEGLSVVVAFAYRREVGMSLPWPPEYDGDVFYIDFYDDGLKRLTGSGQDWSIAPDVPGQPAPGVWADGLNQAADFAITPSGSVVWVSLAGTLSRIRFTGDPTNVEGERTSWGAFRSRYR